MTTFTARAQKAFDHIQQGAKFVRQLEQNNYTGHNHWCYRLVKDGVVIRGYGFSAYNELNVAGVRGLIR